MIPRSGVLVAAVAIALLIPRVAALAADGAPLHLDLRDPGWELSGEGTVVEEFDGRVALRLKSGSATWRGIQLLDGTIEFDLQVTPYRSFSYVYFRMETDKEHEEFYFRSHKSGLPDAVQYAPVYKGSSQWQLYHDARSTAAAWLPSGEWIPIKVVVQGVRAAVFVGAAETPQLLVPKLAREPKPGPIALRSFMTFGTPADAYVSNFANVVVRPGVVDYEFPEVAAAAPPAGLIANWRVSSAFSPPNDLLTVLPKEVLTGGGWQTVAANADGLVELERHVTRPAGIRRAGLLARLRVTAGEATTRRLDLGFSDEVSVFLNGRLLVADDESYSFNLPRRQGLLTSQQLSVFLPLDKGANELVLAIVDRFGGWGLSGSFEDMTDLVVEAWTGTAEAGTEEAATMEAAGVAQEERAAGRLAGLAWLAGCWQGEAGEECWLAPRGGMMIGVNRAPDQGGPADVLRAPAGGRGRRGAGAAGAARGPVSGGAVPGGRGRRLPGGLRQPRARLPAAHHLLARRRRPEGTCRGAAGRRVAGLRADLVAGLVARPVSRPSTASGVQAMPTNRSSCGPSTLCTATPWAMR